MPLVVILGPTAAGKTELAIQLAERFDGEIVSADSRLFYRGMDIGTAKPTIEERMRVPHHLIDVADPDETWSLAVFQQEANKVIHDIYEDHHQPFMVGGTGQFVRSVIEGWKVPSVKPDSRMREVLTELSHKVGPIELHAKLAILDTQAANSIDPTNIRRTIRALEVILSTGKRFSDQKMSGFRLYKPLIVGLTRPRVELYQRIDDRITFMIENGFIDEVQRLLDMGYSPDLPTMSAIGYAEIVATIQAKITLDEAIVLIKRRTRKFVRRQANWFKENDPAIHWYQVNAGTLDEVGKLISAWLIPSK
ncbi:MAG: tRNA (adenosine(37)-N6)-dimethylallyltransferase MiaA [Chloroflexi bacterium RBG_13_48_10]|nr:MAG: tRNA (adenosine(37)-N6)-dimethylallyltransferase MiaA [Chloroflexi bacterium RBG_13_48_10]